MFGLFVCLFVCLLDGAAVDRDRLEGKAVSQEDVSLWSVLKQCIGKELSKITMPISFNEPLSFLQRLAEYMEYSQLLHQADETEDPIQRMQVSPPSRDSIGTAEREREREMRVKEMSLGGVLERVRGSLRNVKDSSPPSPPPLLSSNGRHQKGDP